MRLFLSVNLPEPIKQELQLVQSHLQTKTKTIRWLNSNGMHITLKFIGKYPESELSIIQNALQPLSNNINPFDVELGGFGTFSQRGKPSILWVGITNGSTPLTTLSNTITTALQKNNIPVDLKPLVPHITIGRAQKRKPVFIPENLHIPLKDTRFHVQSFYLMESQLLPEGAVYTQRIEFLLKG